jgi:hypothetical protein
MLTAVSTNTPLQVCASAHTVVRNVCSCAVILSCFTSSLVPSVPIQQMHTERPALFSIDLANKSAYDNGNISFSWDGVSVMSVDRTKSILRILEIEKLQDNWNCNGATSFSKEILSLAKTIIFQLSVQPQIFPTARDSIQFEYENAVGDYLEFELFDDGQLKMFSFSRSGRTETSYIAIGEMNEVVNRFYGRNV